MASAPARLMSVNCVHAIRGRVNFATSNLANGVEIGTIPAGSFVEPVHVHVITAFNAATTNDVTVGTATTAAAFAAAANVAAGTAGFKASLTGTGTGDTLTADTPVVVKYTQAGTAATAGDMEILVKFYPHMT